MLTVKLAKSESIDPQDTGPEPVVNPPCWASIIAVSFNLTIPFSTARLGTYRCPHRRPGTCPPGSPASDDNAQHRSGAPLVKHARYYWLLLAERQGRGIDPERLPLDQIRRGQDLQDPGSGRRLDASEQLEASS